MPEKLNLSMGTPNNGDKKGGKKMVKYATFDQVLDWIKSLKHDDYTTKELIKIVSKYPFGTYYKFKDDLPKHIASIQKSRKNNE